MLMKSSPAYKADMDEIEKTLEKLSEKEKEIYRMIFEKIKRGDLRNFFDIKKLKGKPNTYRLRKGSMRIIYRREGSEIKILRFEKRNDHTYRK